MKELVENINAHMEAFKVDAEKFVNNGNKAAGVRARVASLELEKLMKQFRKESKESTKRNGDE